MDRNCPDTELDSTLVFDCRSDLSQMQAIVLKHLDLDHLESQDKNPQKLLCRSKHLRMLFPSPPLDQGNNARLDHSD
jgi:hypothetical protein